MLIADLGTAAVIVLAIAVLAASWLRGYYRRKHPPLTMAEETARLEDELRRINDEIGE